MTMNRNLKRVAAGLLAVAVVAGAVPGTVGDFDVVNTDIVASASAATTPTFKSASVTLNSNIGLNFILDGITEAQMSNYKVLLQGQCDENGTLVPLTLNKLGTPNDYVVATANVNAKDMEEKITATLCNNSGVSLGIEKTYSVNDYLDLAKEKIKNTTTQEQIKATRVYGQVADYYFDGTTEESAFDNDLWIGWGNSYYNDHGTEFAPSYKTNTALDGTTLAAVLRSKTKLRVYPVINGTPISAGETATYGTTTLTSKSTKQGACFEIPDIAPGNLGKAQTITYGTYSFSVSVLSWVYNVMTSEAAEDKDKNMARAIAYYASVTGASGIYDPEYEPAPSGVINLPDQTEPFIIDADKAASNGYSFTFTGTAPDGFYITVSSGLPQEVTITLDTVTIERQDNKYGDAGGTTTVPGIKCLSNTTIILKGENKIRPTHIDAPCIYVNSKNGVTLTIDGDGKLDVNQGGSGNDSNLIGSGAAAIGGSFKGTGLTNAGNIIIKGGEIIATGGSQGGAAIGASNSGQCGTITITGGKIIAYGGNGAAAIGTGLGAGGVKSLCKGISITGGTITVYKTATGNYIGAGYNGVVTNNNIVVTVNPDEHEYQIPQNK